MSRPRSGGASRSLPAAPRWAIRLQATLVVLLTALWLFTAASWAGWLAADQYRPDRTFVSASATLSLAVSVLASLLRRQVLQLLFLVIGIGLVALQWRSR